MRSILRSVGGKSHSPSEETESVYLTAQELNDLYHLDLTGHPRLDRARDYSSLVHGPACGIVTGRRSARNRS